MPPRQMVLVGFLQAQNCTNLPASWRHPESRTDFCAPDYYQEIGRVLERGKFHLAFFDDRLAMPDRYGADHGPAVEHGIRCVKMDPIPVMMAMGAATTRLGLGSTYSTTYYEPFHVARLFATIDLMTNGRAAWNVVTSLNDGEAMNMGRGAVMEHDLRYDRADEFMEVVLGHWDSWDDGAIEVDKKSGRFADPAKVRRLDHAGEYFRSRGPFTVPRTPQGHPVIIQAGQSGRGRRFAGRWGEVIFATAASLPHGKEGYAALKGEAERAGRDPDAMSICLSLTCVAGETKAAAEDKMALLETLPLEIDALALLSEGLNFDFAEKGMDEPLSDRNSRGFPASCRSATASSGRAARRTRRCATSSASTIAAGSPARSSADQGRSPTGSRNCSWGARATGSSWVRRTCRGLTMISCASSCRNCSAAGYSTRITRAPPCARICACRAPPSARGRAL